MSIEFLGALYCGNKLNRDCQLFVCRRYQNPKRGGYQTNFNCFQIEMRPQIQKENPGRSGQWVTNLIAQVWKTLPADRKAYYDRKSKESISDEQVTVKCTGRLRFRLVNGRPMIDADNLLEYEKHSELLSIGIN